MTSANKILIIEGGPPITFSLQDFLWQNGWLQTQIIPDKIDSAILKRLNPDLIIYPENSPNQPYFKQLPHPILSINYQKESKDIDDKTHFQRQEILAAINSIFSKKQMPQEQHDFLLIRQNGKLLNITIDDILFVESDGNQVNLQTIEGKNYSFNNSLLKMNSILPEGSFLRIHKKYIVQFPLIESILPSARKVILQNHEIPIGRTFKDDLLAKFKVVN